MSSSERPKAATGGTIGANSNSMHSIAIFKSMGAQWALYVGVFLSLSGFSLAAAVSNQVPAKLAGAPRSTEWVPANSGGCEDLLRRANGPKVSAEFSNKMLEIINDPNASEDDRRTARWELGLFTAAEAKLADQLAGAHQVIPSLDQVFAENERGEYQSASRDLVISSSGSEIVPRGASPPYEQLHENIMRQLRGSKLFTGFELNMFSSEIQYLKIKPVRNWSPASKALFNQIMYMHSDLDKGYFQDSWIYAFYNTKEIGHFGNSPVMSFISEFSSVLKPMVDRPSPPMNFSRLQGLFVRGTPEAGVQSLLSRLGYLKVRPNLPFSEGLGARAGSPENFYIPVDIIDWENSYFVVSLTREIPPGPGSVATRSHSIQILTTDLGRQALLVGGSSGRLQTATIKSGALDHLPPAWNQVPTDFMTLPKDLNDLNAYLDFLDRTQFSEGGQPGLINGVDRNSRLLPGR